MWEQIYDAERQRRKYFREFEFHDYNANDKAQFVKSLFKREPYTFDPPSDMTFVELRDFLQLALGKRRNHSTDHIYLDDRRHHLQRAVAGRLDINEDHGGYIGIHELLSPQTYVPYVRSTKRHEKDANAEKRAIYIPSPSCDSMLALLVGTSQRSMAIMVKFLQDHLALSRVKLDVSCDDKQFALSFELPYYALRSGLKKIDRRQCRGKSLRESYDLPLVKGSRDGPFAYYEAKTSFLVYGADDHLWTSICLADTYHGAEDDRATYFTFEDYGIDPASGRRLLFPYWNPRECFLDVLAKRLDQATKEISGVINNFESFMRSYERTCKCSCSEGNGVGQFDDLEQAIPTMKRLLSRVRNMISAWSKFSDRSLHWFTVEDNKPLNEAIAGALGRIRTCIHDLEDLRDLLEDRETQFRDQFIRTGHAITARQNTIASEMQKVAAVSGNYMKLLAGISFFFLPLGLVVAIFGMNMVSSKIHPAIPVLTLVTVAIAFHRLATQPRLLARLFPLEDS